MLIWRESVMEYDVIECKYIICRIHIFSLSLCLCMFSRDIHIPRVYSLYYSYSLRRDVYAFQRHHMHSVKSYAPPAHHISNNTVLRT